MLRTERNRIPLAERVAGTTRGGATNVLRARSAMIAASADRMKVAVAAVNARIAARAASRVVAAADAAWAPGAVAAARAVSASGR